MIFPKFLKPGDTIGICAPSRGIDKEDTTFDVSLNNLKKEGYNIIETDNVRTGLLPSSDALTRATEFNELMRNKDVNFIFSASGGDFLIEILPYINEKLITYNIEGNNAKWFAGYSDPTSLLYYITTKFDVATLYGVNAGSFDQENLYKNLQDALEIMKGNIVEQESFPMYEKLSYEEKQNLTSTDYVLNNEVKWLTPNGDVSIKGRLIGGCIDCLKSIVGTRFDYTKDFVKKYENDGILWYFDNFALIPEDLYYTLWQMREAGWFENASGFIFGRTKYEGPEENLTYVDAVKRALGPDIPIIMDADIGHVKPTFTLINGAIGHFESSNGKGKFKMEILGGNSNE